jgi:CBS domain-containing protein
LRKKLVMTIGDLCNRDVVIAQGHESAALVASLMVSHHVGCVVIVDGEPGRWLPIGIVTDRDLALGVVAEDRAPSQTPIASVMSSEPYVAREEQDDDDVLHEMRARGLRRVPVVDRTGALQGLFTFDDFVEWTAERMLQLTQLVKRELQREGDRPQPAPH